MRARAALGKRKRRRLEKVKVAGGQVESFWELGFRGGGRRSWLGASRISITDGRRQARVHV
jgi:hypothetical protein